MVSNEAAVLQTCHVSDVHETSAVSNMPASWEVVCRWAPHPVFAIISGFSNTTTLQRRITTTAVGRRSCRTHENCMHAEQIIIILYIFIFIFCSMYLVLFSIVLYRTIVTVYTDNIFLYYYLWQMHQIIHLSPVESQFRIQTNASMNAYLDWVNFNHMIYQNTKIGIWIMGWLTIDAVTNNCLSD